MYLFAFVFVLGLGCSSAWRAAVGTKESASPSLGRSTLQTTGPEGRRSMDVAAAHAAAV